MNTIRKCDNCLDVAVAKALMGYSEYSREFTADFETYVKKWQKEQNLSVDGVIGANSWKELVNDAKTVSTSKNRKSNWAAAAQLLTGAACDSIYGSKTKAAIAAAQKAGGLTADGICGPKTWSLLVLGIVEEHGKKSVQPPNMKQGDSRWSKYPYTSCGDKTQTIGSSGCGILSLIMIIIQWWDKAMTPQKLADTAVAKGYRTKSSGTNASFFRYMAKQYAGEEYVNSKYKTCSSLQTAIDCLDVGGYVICNVGKGSKYPNFFTKGGHYILIWKYDGTNWYINDPASSSAARAKTDTAHIKDALKGFYCFYPPEK